MSYDFDTVIDRSTSDCEKWGNTQAVFGAEGLLPLWIADMDFPCAEPIIEAIRCRAEHSVLGYYMRRECYWLAVVRWFARRTGWQIQAEWMRHSPGVVSGVAFAMLATTNEGDGVMIQQPVYHPFANLIRLNNRRLVNNSLCWTQEGYQIDFDDFEVKARESKVFILCNPHNPTGRCFTREELLRMGEICLRHGVRIIADEIHADFIYRPAIHIHIASLGEELAQNTITFVAPSKSFNIAGLCTAIAIAKNESLRDAYWDEMNKIHVDNSNIFGAVAMQAAYNQCEDWLEDMLTYLEGNIDYVRAFLSENLPSIGCHKPEATFLLWLDFRAWGMTEEQLSDFLIQKARLGMNRGSMFGAEGTCFTRMNVGAPRQVIKKAMNQLLNAARNEGLV